MTGQFIDVTTDQARSWLRATHQYQIDLRKSRWILDLLDRGEWSAEADRETSKPVKIRNGVCIDGHHRLLAVLINGAPIRIYVETV